MKLCFKLIYLLLLFINAPALAQENLPLPAHQAFAFSAQMTQPQAVTLTWNIAPHYHLYRDRITFNFVSSNSIDLSTVNLPQGTTQQDKILGFYQAFTHKLAITLPVPSGRSTLAVSYQGCADFGFCYPPITQYLTVELQPQVSATHINISTTPPKTTAIATITSALSAQDQVTDLLQKHTLWLTLLAFFGFGLLLTFTPCVLPMIPILSSIIAGQSQRTAGQTFLLSLSYVLGMAMTYAIAGVIAATAGYHLQTALQSPSAIIISSGIFLLLALSLFGLFELRLPTRWQQWATQLSNRPKGGTYLGCWAMGALSTLVVSPCVTAPLIGALSYISQTGNQLLGGSALFIMALGMGVPLLVIGTAQKKFLPSAGPWLRYVKIFFGWVMVAMALWLLGRIVPYEKFWLSIKPAQQQTNSAVVFTAIATLEQFNHKLLEAQQLGKVTVLDFYADWCTSCKVMARTTFTDPTVNALLSNLQTLQVDVTTNSSENQRLLKHFNVIGPPAILFFDDNGQELTRLRWIGEANAEQLSQHLSKLRII